MGGLSRRRWVLNLTTIWRSVKRRGSTRNWLLWCMIERCLNLGKKRRKRERFGDKILHITIYRFHVWKTRHEKDFQVWIQFIEHVLKLWAVDARHHHVDQGKINLTLVG